jgi:hypothetical protein
MVKGAIRSWIGRGNVLGLIAIFIALGGTAVAARATDNNAGAHSAKKKKVKIGPRGPQGQPGPTGPQGQPGPAGSARAYGRSSAGGVITDSKNVIGNATGGTGIYCITLDPSIDASNANVLATPNNNDDSTQATSPGYEAIVEWASVPSFDCGAGNVIEVVTRELDTGSGSVSKTNEGFSFMVP